MKKISDLQELSASLIASFYKVTELAGAQLENNVIEIRYWGMPHTVEPLEKNKMAVYVFVRNGECLKVGKVGPKSQARYVSHHYKPSSSKSNLAKSLLQNNSLPEFEGFTEESSAEWIKTNVERINFVLHKDAGIPILNLLESFLQCSLEPRFEGFKNQR